MQNRSLPNKTILLVKAGKLLQVIEKYKSDIQPHLSHIESDIICSKVKRDGCSIVTGLLGYSNIEEYPFEHALGLVWYISLTPDVNISPLDIIEKWTFLDEDNKRRLIDSFQQSTHACSHLESFHFIHNLEGIDANKRKNIISSLEVLFLDYYGHLVNVDNTVSDLEKEKYDVLKRLMRLDYSKISENKAIESGHGETIESVLAELDKLIGLSEIKNEVKSLINFVKINQLRKSKGLPAVSLSLHTVFFGPPGTGKTTIARLISRAFKCLGLLKKGHLTEADRSKLVAGYVGQTSIKVKEVIDKSLDGVLFIDEAYSLHSDDDFGKEAINTLLKYMEDYRERLVVIVAGYEKEMTGLLSSNPGLKSRFNKYFYFQNYSASELLEIFLTLITKNKFVVSDDVKNKLIYIINDAIFSEGTHFGNARYIRNLYEQIVQRQFHRVSQQQNSSMDEKFLSEITVSDLS